MGEKALVGGVAVIGAEHGRRMHGGEQSFGAAVDVPLDDGAAHPADPEGGAEQRLARGGAEDDDQLGFDERQFPQQVTVKLRRPLGDRVLLDACTGRPLPYRGTGGRPR